MKKTLTEKQYSFVANYIKNGFNAYRAALDAGYKPSYAKTKTPELIQHPIIKQKIEKAIARFDEEMEEKLAISLQHKAKILAQIIYDIIPQDGSPPKRKYYKYAINALAELSKMQGHYAPDRSLKVTVDTTKEKLKEVRRQYEEY